MLTCGHLTLWRESVGQFIIIIFWLVKVLQHSIITQYLMGLDLDWTCDPVIMNEQTQTSESWDKLPVVSYFLSLKGTSTPHSYLNATLEVFLAPILQVNCIRFRTCLLLLPTHTVQWRWVKHQAHVKRNTKLHTALSNVCPFNLFLKYSGISLNNVCQITELHQLMEINLMNN